MDVTWTRRRAGLYAAEVARPDLGVTVELTVEQADESNSDHGDRGWWRFDYVATSAAGNPAGSDTGEWMHGTMREAKAAAVEFVGSAVMSDRFGLCAAWVGLVT